MCKHPAFIELGPAQAILGNFSLNYQASLGYLLGLFSGIFRHFQANSGDFRRFGGGQNPRKKPVLVNKIRLRLHPKIIRGNFTD